MITGHRRHAQGGSSHQHASIAALQTGVYGGIDQLTQLDIGAAFRPIVWRTTVGDGGGGTTSAVFVTLATFTPLAGKRPIPMYVRGVVTAVVGSTAEGRIRFTLDDASTVDTATASTGGIAEYFASWGYSTFGANGDAWAAVVSADNLFTRLDESLNGRYITQIEFQARLTAGVGPAFLGVEGLQVGGFYI